MGYLHSGQVLSSCFRW